MITLKQIDKNSTEFDEVYNIRLTVFTGEQNVPINMLVDDADENAVQIAAYENESIVGCGRIVINENIGIIGRVAVLADKRKFGIGKLICEKLINIAVADYNVSEITLQSQCTARKFYEKLGFTADGGTFVKAGIEHIEMKKEVTAM